MLRVGKVTNANGAARDFIFISGANAALGCADFNAINAVFANTVEFTVDGQDKWRALGNQ